MRRLLTTANKRSIKEAFKGNAVFRTIDAAYKEQETQMATLRFSPEEIWVNCFIGFDQILKNRDDIGEITRRMWYETFCELRDDAQEASRAFQKEELETATSCIVYSIIACMTASDDWEIIQHTETLMFQIAEHSELDTIATPFDNNTESNFAGYIQRYISTGKYISDRLESPKSYADPINPVCTPQERTKIKNGVRKRLEFMKGYLPDSEILIMTSSNFNTMIEAVEYLIENDVVKKQVTKISTNLPVSHLRYTFYLVYKNEGKCIKRQLWLEFLGETFAQMQDNAASLSKHFSDVPDGYDKYLKPKKKK
ncbi:MAG: hypothetical protein J6W52_08580 [Bacteroidaceae bacterium]|nr:hypothetical protein [Bacteroidaceae bacterium]